LPTIKSLCRLSVTLLESISNNTSAIIIAGYRLSTIRGPNFSLSPIRPSIIFTHVDSRPPIIFLGAWSPFSWKNRANALSGCLQGYRRPRKNLYCLEPFRAVHLLKPACCTEFLEPGRPSTFLKNRHKLPPFDPTSPMIPSTVSAQNATPQFVNAYEPSRKVSHGSSPKPPKKRINARPSY
jgi:hypothetical protein